LAEFHRPSQNGTASSILAKDRRAEGAGPATVQPDATYPLLVLEAASNDWQIAKRWYIVPYDPRNVTANWRPAFKHAVGDGLCLHDLRHESASELFGSGKNTPGVALLTGHRDGPQLKQNTQPHAAELGILGLRATGDVVRTKLRSHAKSDAQFAKTERNGELDRRVRVETPRNGMIVARAATDGMFPQPGATQAMSITECGQVMLIVDFLKVI
jgi:hypothetical protein